MNSCINISYDKSNLTAEFSVDPTDYEEHWVQQIIRLINDITDENTTIPIGTIICPWWVFISIRKEIGTILKIYHIKCLFSEDAKLQLQKTIQNEKSYYENKNLDIVPLK